MLELHGAGEAEFKDALPYGGEIAGEEEKEDAEFVNEVCGEFKSGNVGACRESHGDETSDEVKEEDVESVAGEISGGTNGACRESDGDETVGVLFGGTEFAAVSLHTCHQHAHVATSPSVSCGRACGLPSVGSVGALGWVRGRVSARSAWGCCPGCGLYGDGTLCMACDLGTHGGANSCTIDSSGHLRAVRSAEVGAGTKPSKVSSRFQVGVPIVENVPGNARLADYLRWAPRRWPFEARECRVVNSPFVETREFVLARGCEVV